MMEVAVEDVYASRHVDEPMLVDRDDPVVRWERGATQSGPLSVEQLKQFDTRGYLFLESLFDEGEVKQIAAELDRLRGDERVRMGQQTIREPASGEVRSIFEVHKLSDLYALLAADERIVAGVKQIFGADVYVHQSRVNLKPGFEGKEFYWHSDFETWHMEDGLPRMAAISCSILLTENNPYNGPLMVIPGSHLKYVVCSGGTPENHHEQSLRKQEYGVPSREMLSKLVDEGGIVAPVGKAGSVLLFDCNLMHGSSGNLSPWARSNAFYVYNSVENAPVEPFCGHRPRPGYIASREVDPVQMKHADYRRVGTGLKV